MNDNNNFGSDRMNYTFAEKTISDGIKICTVKADGFKTACASLNFSVPLSEKASYFAMLPNILTRSSALYPDLTAVERRLALLYGADISVDVSKYGDTQVLKVTVSCIDDRFSLDGESITNACLEMLFQLVFNPKIENGGFSRDETESEKRLLCERIAAEKSDKRLYAKNRCEEIMFGDEVYGINRLGSVEVIEKITPEELYEMYKVLLSQAEITLCLCGGDFSKGEEMLANAISAVERKPVKTATEFKKTVGEVKYLKEKEDLKQGKLVMGFRMGMENDCDLYGARRVMVDLFGGSPHSKLFTVVREKMSLCYYCSARMIRSKGIMFVQSGIESYNEEKAKNAILGQLQDIRDGKFTEEDIEASVKSLEDSFKSVSDSPEALDAWFMSQITTGKLLYPEDFIEQFKNVNKESIKKAAEDVVLDTVFMLEGNEKGGEADE